jgi:hypothetical protein
MIRRTTELVGLVVTLMFAAWLVDTWTHGSLSKWAREWWDDLAAPRMAPADVKALADSVVAEAIHITRVEAEGV